MLSYFHIIEHWLIISISTGEKKFFKKSKTTLGPRGNNKYDTNDMYNKYSEEIEYVVNDFGTRWLEEEL